jgi:opacity protein-like surface antigen
MKKFVAAAALAAAFAMPAYAQSADMAELKCSDLVAMTSENAGTILFWIDGYVSHKTGLTTIDPEGIKADAEKIATYCVANPDAKVLEYIESATN